MTEPLGFDLETADASQLFALRDEFVTLAGFTASPDASGVDFTSDMQELIKLLEAAPYVYGHGITTFDLLTLAYGYGMDWEAITRKAIDTELLDRLDYPPMARDTGGSIDKYDLDHVAKRRGVPGKSGSIKDIAAKHGGYDKIPLDDPEFREYLSADVIAIRELMTQLPFKGNAYAKREHAIASWNGRMTLNGLRVDVPLLEKRIAEGSAHKKLALQLLADDFDLPLGRFEWSGKGNDKIEAWLPFESPLTTLEGRRWLIEVWAAFGVRNPPITETGRLSVSAGDLRPIADSGLIHPDLRRILELMIEVTTARTIYQTIQDHMVGDRVHPLIVMRQASGRSSVTSPGLTVMGKRGPRLVREREVILADEGEVLVSADLAQVDMRGVAWHSRDRNYAKLFEPGKNIHKETALLFFGDESHYPEAKSLGHGANYGQSPKTLIDKGHNPDRVHQFFQRRAEEFPQVMSWTEEIREQAKAGQLLDNGFGRLMRPDPARYYTQAPALMGQGTAADILKEATLRLPEWFRPLVKLDVHDEKIVSCKPENAKDVQRELRRAMTFPLVSSDGEFEIPILCDVSEPGENWGVVSAK